MTLLRVPGMSALAVYTVLGFTGYAALLPVAPLWATRGGADATGAGLVNAALLFATIAAQPLVPGALVRFGWPAVLAGGAVLLGAPCLPLALDDGLPSILAWSAVRGIGFAVLTVCGSAAVAHLNDPARRGEAVGLYGLAVGVPNVVALPLGPWLAERVGFGVVMALAAAPLLGAFVARPLGLAVERAEAAHPHGPDTDAPTGREETGREETGREETGRGEAGRGEAGVASRRGLLGRLVRPCLLLLSVTVAGGGVISFAPQYAPDAGVSAAALLAMGGVSAVARWRVGLLADRHGAATFLVPLTLATCVGLALIAWAGRGGGVSGGADVALLLTGAVVLGVAYGALQNLTLVIALEAVPRRGIGLASAVWNVGFDAGTGLGSLVVGALAARLAFAGAFGVLAAAALLAVPLAAARRRV